MGNPQPHNKERESRTFRKGSNEEEEYFARAAISVLPEWVHSPETEHQQSIDELGACLLPNEALKVVSPPVPEGIPNRRTPGEKALQKIVSALHLEKDPCPSPELTVVPT